MSNIIEAIAACVLFVVSMTAYIAAIFGFVVLCNRLKGWFQGVPYVSRKQRECECECIAMWRLRQIGERRMDSRTACQTISSEAELLASEAASLREGERAKREIAAKEIAAKEKAAQPVPPEPTPPEILFADGKAVIRPHTRMCAPVSTMRLTFQDGTEWDISADLEFAGLGEEEFRVAYAAFTKTQAELHDLKGQPPPALNSKFWRRRP